MMHAHARMAGALLACWLMAAGEALGHVDSLASGGSGEGELEFFPILSYDTDVGLGYGGKGFAVNELGGNESFDLTLFNSSKGERWYRLVASLPDFERRQGTVYPVALDLLIDYDKMIAASFFGVGPDSRSADREYYTKEPLEISITCSRGFAPDFVGQVGIRYRTVRNYNFSAGSRLRSLRPNLNSSRATEYSLFAVIRLDTRNSFINATEGEVAQLEWERAPWVKGGSALFARVRGVGQLYRHIVGALVLAARLDYSVVSGSDIPVQIMIPVGGGSTLRGSPQDRFLGKVGAVANVEVRFPLVWRFGGIVGGDAGRVWDRPGAVGIAGWDANTVAGVRFFMNTFIVRLDVGFGRESTGLYLNFGHIF